MSEESSADEQDVYSDLDEEKDAELEAELAALENFEIPDLGEVPLLFNPTSIYSKNAESLSKELFQAEQFLTRRVTDLNDFALEIEENDPGANIENVESTVKEILDQVATLQSYRNHLEISKEIVKSSNGEPLKDAPSKRFFEETRKDIAAYSAKTPRNKYGSSDIFKAFKQSIWEVNHPGEDMPSTWLGIGDASDGDNSDEDIIISRQVETLKCPITCSWFEDPVTSINCKHSFSKAAIVSLLRRDSSGSIDCPVAGCSRKITSNCLEPNYQLARKLERAKTQKDKHNEATQGQNSNVFVLE